MHRCIEEILALWTLFFIPAFGTKLDLTIKTSSETWLEQHNCCDTLTKSPKRHHGRKLQTFGYTAKKKKITENRDQPKE